MYIRKSLGPAMESLENLLKSGHSCGDFPCRTT